MIMGLLELLLALLKQTVRPEFLNRIEYRAVILHVYEKEEYYDYKIYVEGKNKIKKVHQRHLFPDPASTY